MGGKHRKNSSNPFRELKGFRVSGKPAGAGDRPPPAAEQPAGSPVEDDRELFAREMARLGVQGRPLDAGVAPLPEPSAPAEAGAPPKDDRELFLRALGEMDAVFRDELPEPPEPAAVPRRMKLLRQGKLTPEATLDLHGLTRLQAREKVRNFLANAAWQGERTVLVVTGRGHGSAGEPVLRAEVERYLREEAGREIAEWGRAPARYGGDGALVVFLRRRGE